MEKSKLVIGVKPNEIIRIGDDVEIEITAIGQFKVDVAFYAPRSVKILRDGLKKFSDEGSHGKGRS